MDKADLETEQLLAENQKLRTIASELQWMARRYANGRTSYAPFTVNEHTAALIRMGVLLNGCGERQIFARDGMDGQVDPKSGAALFMLPPDFIEAEKMYLAGDIAGARELLRNSPSGRV